ncbi:SDR family NAD(P)-dependent oxidoreductase [Arcobacter sp. YIC-464]|uniref:SDR family NAD(P)-dependent oxidoreductase n=1 Tax=Arcobacter sp. YIC-464 TaxID=3376631 RepID=UPI003C146117
MSKNILITGCSSGLGLALTNLYLNKGFKVYGISRTKPNIENKNFIFKEFDLSKIENIKPTLKSFIEEIKNIEVVYLNAGMLGEIKSSFDVNVSELKEVYELNVYANKELLDLFVNIEVKNIIAISSGASVNGSKGWASYSLSKAGVNMLINLYSKELTNTTLLAVAPGVIETPMTDYIRFDINDEEFPSAKRLKESNIQKPNEAAARLDNVVTNINKFTSGDFIDVRNI